MLCMEESLKKILKELPDIDVVHKIIMEKEAEENRHKNELKQIDIRFKGKYTEHVLYMMWELVSLDKDRTNLLNPIDKDGIVEYKSGLYLDPFTISFSKDGEYVRIQDSWGTFWIFPIEVFKYPNNSRKMKSIYRRFLKRRVLSMAPKKIEDYEKAIKSYSIFIDDNKKMIESIKKGLLKIKRDPTLTPLNLDDIEFNNEESE